MVVGLIPKSILVNDLAYYFMLGKEKICHLSLKKVFALTNTFKKRQSWAGWLIGTSI